MSRQLHLFALKALPPAAEDRDDSVMGRPCPTVAEYSVQWLRERAGPPYHAEHVRRHARGVLRAYLLPSLGGIRLNLVRPAHMAALQRQLFDRGLALNTVRNAIYGVWGAIWLCAQAEGLVRGPRPHGELRWPRSTDEPDPFSREERARILRWFASSNPRYLPFVACVFLAGMRPSEAAGLRWGDVDVETGAVTIRQAIVCREVTRGKTRKARRAIYVSDALRMILARAKPSWATSAELVTRSRFGGAVDTQQWGRWHFARCCRELGLRYRGFYAGRATYISLALLDGARIEDVSKFCATSIWTIERHYWRWLERLDDPVEKTRRRAPSRATGRGSYRRVGHGR